MVTYAHNFPQMIFMAMHAFATCAFETKQILPILILRIRSRIHNSCAEIQSVSKTHDIICKQSSHFVLKFATAETKSTLIRTRSDLCVPERHMNSKDT